MNKHLIAITALVASLAVCQVLAQNEIGELAAVATDAALAPVDSFAAEQSVNAQLQNFLVSEVGQKLQAKPDNKVLTAYMATSKSANSAGWAISRSLAYDRAWATIQEQFIRWKYQQFQDETVRRLYEDASSGTPNYQPPKYTGSEAVDEIIEKSGAYVSSKLDAALRVLIPTRAAIRSSVRTCWSIAFV